MSALFHLYLCGRKAAEWLISMKRFACLLLILFLTGCANAKNEIERGMALRSKLLSAEYCSFDVGITADYGDNLYNFTLFCEADSSGDLTFDVKSPESISGITGRIDAEGGKLTFDDTVLFFDMMADDQISPISAPWVFLKTLRSGYLTSAGMEENYLRLTIDDSYADDALQLDIWLGEGDAPVRCEILHDGRRILSLDVENFQIR